MVKWLLIFIHIWQQEEAQQSSEKEEVKESKGDKEKKKEEFFDGKTEVGTNHTVTFVVIPEFTLLKKKFVHNLVLKVLIDEILQFIVHVLEKLPLHIMNIFFRWPPSKLIVQTAMCHVIQIWN